MQIDDFLGTYIWSDGRRYEGQWKENQMHGKGSFTWPEGKTYIGEYYKDERHGPGMIKW